MLLFVPYSLFSSCCFLLITSVPCKYHQHSRTFVPLCLLKRMRDNKNIWIPVNFPRQMNESQGISSLSKLTAAMGYNYINRLYTAIHLNWSVTNVSLGEQKGIYYHPISERQLVFKWLFCNSCVSTRQESDAPVPPGAPDASCAGSFTHPRKEDRIEDKIWGKVGQQCSLPPSRASRLWTVQGFSPSSDGIPNLPGASRHCCQLCWDGTLPQFLCCH